MTEILEFDLQKKSMLKIIEFFDKTKKILILTNNPIKYQNISSKIEFSLEIPKLVFSDIGSSHDYLLDKNNLDIITRKQNYDVIVLDQILEFLPDTAIFLKNISEFLSSSGIIVGCIYNFSNIINRIKFIDGEFNEIKSHSPNFPFFSLENILFLLSNSNLKITRLDRIEKEITISNQTKLKNYVLPQELIDSIKNDPESQTFFYVFSAIPNSNVNPKTRKLVSEFSKNLVTEKLSEIFNQIKVDHEKKIIYLTQSNHELYDMIKHLKQGLSDKDAYAEQIIKDKDNFYNNVIDDINKDKDAYAEQIIKDKDAYAEQIIRDKDEIINSLEQSFVFKLLRILEKLRGKT
jgi:hypothetical protein